MNLGGSPSIAMGMGGDKDEFVYSLKILIGNGGGEGCANGKWEQG